MDGWTQLDTLGVMFQERNSALLFLSLYKVFWEWAAYDSEGFCCHEGPC